MLFIDGGRPHFPNNILLHTASSLSSFAPRLSMPISAPARPTSRQMTEGSNRVSPRQPNQITAEEGWSDEEVNPLPPQTNSIPGLPPHFRISHPPGRRQNLAPRSGHSTPPPGVRAMPPGVRWNSTQNSGRSYPPSDIICDVISSSDCASQNNDFTTPEALGPHRLCDIRFRLGMRMVFATGSTINGSSHVLRLRLQPNLIARLLGAVVRILPRAAQSWAKTRWPEWFLPRDIILKKRKENWDEEFENETRMYTRLRKLQGTVIPVCYGLVVVSCGNQQPEPVPALVLSDIGGYELYRPEAGGIPNDQLAGLLQDGFEALARCGVGHGDLKLDNLHLVRDDSNGLRIMVVDLESVEDLADQAKWRFFVKSDVDHISRTYRNHQQCLIDDGLLPQQQPGYRDRRGPL